MLFLSLEGVLKKTRKALRLLLSLSPWLQTWPGLGAGAQTQTSECRNEHLQRRNRGARGASGLEVPVHIIYMGL